MEFKQTKGNWGRGKELGFRGLRAAAGVLLGSQRTGLVYLEVRAGQGERREVTEAEVRGGAVAAEGADVAAADDHHLRHAECRRTPRQGPHVVPLRHVVDNHHALHRRRRRRHGSAAASIRRRANAVAAVVSLDAVSIGGCLARFTDVWVPNLLVILRCSNHPNPTQFSESTSCTPGI